MLDFKKSRLLYVGAILYVYSKARRSSVPPKNNEIIIRKLNLLLVVDSRLISPFLHV